jgi:hypothetical protein
VYADDLFLRVYQQQQRELEQRLRRRLAAQGRRTRDRARPTHHLRLAIRPHRSAGHAG